MEKKIQSVREIKLFGVRVIVGTFDKHNPGDIYFDGTINLEGSGVTKEALDCLKEDLHDGLYSWIKNQDDYDRRRYIKKVECPDTFREQYKQKRTKVRFDLSLIQKQPLSWKETVEVARKHINDLYPTIVHAVILNGLELQDFSGYNNKSTSR